MHLMENEIDMYETDLAESMAIWGFGKDDKDHMSFQEHFFLHDDHQDVVGMPSFFLFVFTADPLAGD